MRSGLLNASHRCTPKRSYCQNYSLPPPNPKVLVQLWLSTEWPSNHCQKPFAQSCNSCPKGCFTTTAMSVNSKVSLLCLRCEIPQTLASIFSQACTRVNPVSRFSVHNTQPFYFCANVLCAFIMRLIVIYFP